MKFFGNSQIARCGHRVWRPRGVLQAVGRLAMWVAVAVVFVRGLGAIASEPADPVSGRGARPAPVEFPDGEARAFAVRFVSAYLTQPARYGAAEFFAEGLSDHAAVDVSSDSSANVASAAVARETRLGRSRALITVAAVTERGTGRYVAVPIARDRQGGLAVYGLPSIVPPPSRAALADDDLSPLGGRGADAIGALASRFVRGFVAGAGRASLAYLLLPDTRIATMPPGLRVLSVDAIDQPASSSNARRRSVVVSVRARDTDSGAVYPLAYRLDLERRDRWYVAAVAGGPSA